MFQFVSKYDTFATSLNVAWCCSGVFAFDRFVSSDDARKRSERDWGGSLDKARAVKVASARNTKPVSSYRFSENSWHRCDGLAGCVEAATARRARSVRRVIGIRGQCANFRYCSHFAHLAL